MWWKVIITKAPWEQCRSASRQQTIRWSKEASETSKKAPPQWRRSAFPALARVIPTGQHFPAPFIPAQNERGAAFGCGRNSPTRKVKDHISPCKHHWRIKRLKELEEFSVHSRCTSPYSLPLLLWSLLCPLHRTQPARVSLDVPPDYARMFVQIRLHPALINQLSAVVVC